MFSVEKIAAAYDRAPLFQLSAYASYQSLAKDSLALALRAQRRLKVVLTSSEEPYSNAADMFADIENRRRLYVSSAHCEHPVFTTDESIAFRIVHDYYGHYMARSGFDWVGEREACKAHSAYVSPEAFPAFFTECYGQAAFRVVNGYLTAQKACFLDIL